ncbi:MAG: hypothetical protein FJX72_09540 [Armatimonadetes bacterium]|nr:hypothetical protein [Armatimonadota bacterium]
MLRALTLVSVMVATAIVARPRLPIAQSNLPRSEPKRWVFIHSQLGVQGGAERAMEVMERSAKLGCNGVVLSDGTFSSAREPSPDEAKRASALLSLGERLGIEIIPAAFGPHAVLRHDLNLVEAMPVRNALFTVEGDLARHEPDPFRELTNRDFEEEDRGKPRGWDVSPGPAKVGLDAAHHYGGRRSLRLDFGPSGASASGSATVSQEIEVEPRRQYALTVWTRSEGFEPPANFQVWIMTVPKVASGKALPLAYTQWRQADGPWRAQHAVFNSIDHRRVRVRLQAANARGRLWVDTLSLAEVGLLNLVRRPGCPFVVRGEDGTVYEEGRDFEPVTDRRMGREGSAGAYRQYHEPPEGIRLAPGSRILKGARLRVSYYHSPVVFTDRVTVCMSEPRAYELARNEIRRVHRLLKPRTYFMSHDEMRIIGWCAACAARGLTPGQLLADNVKRCAAIIREEAPGASIAVWSDMFDPHHNARDDYYIVNGPLFGSWLGLPRDTIIANWNYNKRAQSLRWFADRGHPQVIAGHYDRPISDVATWLDASRGVPGIEGMMYTTWIRKYDDLEAFAKAAWKAK